MTLVAGFRGSLPDLKSTLEDLRRIGEAFGVAIQLLDASLVYGKEHLLSAVEHARRSFSEGTNATGSLSLEILLYASGERQIQKALDKMGITPTTTSLALVIGSVQTLSREKVEAVRVEVESRLRLTSDDSVLEGDAATLHRFGISKDEQATVPQERYGELILEKVALVDLAKKGKGG